MLPFVHIVRNYNLNFGQVFSGTLGILMYITVIMTYLNGAGAWKLRTISLICQTYSKWMKFRSRGSQKKYKKYEDTKLIFRSLWWIFSDAANILSFCHHIGLIFRSSYRFFSTWITRWLRFQNLLSSNFPYYI